MVLLKMQQEKTRASALVVMSKAKVRDRQKLIDTRMSSRLRSSSSRLSIQSSSFFQYFVVSALHDAPSSALSLLVDCGKAKIPNRIIY